MNRTSPLSVGLTDKGWEQADRNLRVLLVAPCIKCGVSLRVTRAGTWDALGRHACRSALVAA